MKFIPCTFTLVVLLLSPFKALADTSWFEKLSELRFGREEKIYAIQGEVDLSSMAEDTITKVEGEGLFVPGEFLTLRYYNQSEFSKLRQDKKAIPHELWNKSFPMLRNDVQTTHGTFILRFRGLNPDRLTMTPAGIHHASDWFVVDETGVRRILNFGKIQADPLTSRLKLAFGFPLPAFDNQREFILYGHVSEPLFEGKTVLTFPSFLFSYGDYLSQKDYLRRSILMCITGGLCIVFLFHAFIYLFRLRDISSLYLSLYAFCASILGTFYMFNFNLSIPNFLNTFTFINFTATVFLQKYLLHKMEGLWNPRTLRILNYLTLLILVDAAISIILDSRTGLLLAMVVNFCLASSLIGLTAYWGLRHRIEGIYFFLCGTFLNAIFQSSLVFIMITQGNRSNGYFVLLADFSMAVCLALVNAKEYSRAFHTAQRLSRNLQKEVDMQTEKLRLQKEKLEEQKLELVRTHDELKENDEQKTRFFRSISHELRTPLTLILGTLEETEDPNRMKRSIHMASKHAKRLYRLVNQLLDFQKIALSKVKLRTERVDLLSFLNSFAKTVEDACKKSQIDFHFQAPGMDLGNFIVKAQLDALEKIVFNYLGNALKFTPPQGRVELKLSLNGAFVRVSIQDSGCGIPSDQQTKLFKLFSQIEGPQQHGKQGSGIGLALVKELAQQMHGRVGVDSTEGQGACFWLELPRVLSAAEAHTFLYFDPIPGNRLAMKELLARHQLDSQLYCPSSLEETAQLLENYPIQVLMLSANLGDEGQSLLKTCQDVRPNCWRVLMFDKNHPQENRSISTQGIQSIFSIPADDTFIQELKLRFTPNMDTQEQAILDLVYVEDEEIVRRQFIEAIARHSLIERYEIISTFTEYQKLAQHYRVKVLICDGKLGASEKGTDILAYAAHTSPDTVRILFTGQATADLLAAGIHEGQAQYIIYKPMDYAKEFSIIERYIAESPMETRQVTMVEADIAGHEWHLSDIAPTIPEPIDMEKTVEPAVGTSKATILIVDDVRDMRIILRDILHDAGYRVLQAENGADALTMLRASTQRVDLVIADWMMPVKTGVDLIQDLHSDPALASIPTILLTAKSDDESRSVGLKVGASAYLSKPFDHLEILSIIGNLLELKEREKQLADLNSFISNNVLQRFLPPELVKDLVAGKAVFDDAAKLQTITVLFADLCEFTSSTERLGPTKLARILNSFLISMTDVIFEEGGTIDKFIGDAILVIFGAPGRLDPMEQVRRAYRCALRMQERLVELNQQWLEVEKHTFQMRMGIHNGSAIVGSFGGQKRSDYTAIGQTVNIAARIESQAQPGEILVSMEVRDYLEDGVWELAGKYELKGVAMPLNLYRIIQQEKKSAA